MIEVKTGIKREYQKLAYGKNQDLPNGSSLIDHGILSNDTLTLVDDFPRTLRNSPASTRGSNPLKREHNAKLENPNAKMSRTEPNIIPFQAFQTTIPNSTPGFSFTNSTAASSSCLPGSSLTPNSCSSSKPAASELSPSWPTTPTLPQAGSSWIGNATPVFHTAKHPLQAAQESSTNYHPPSISDDINADNSITQPSTAPRITPLGNPILRSPNPNPDISTEVSAVQIAESKNTKLSPIKPDKSNTTQLPNANGSNQPNPTTSSERTTAKPFLATSQNTTTDRVSKSGTANQSTPVTSPNTTSAAPSAATCKKKLTAQQDAAALGLACQKYNAALHATNSMVGVVAKANDKVGEAVRAKTEAERTYDRAGVELVRAKEKAAEKQKLLQNAAAELGKLWKAFDQSKR